MVKSSHVNSQTPSKADKLSNGLIQCAPIARNTRYTVSCTEEDEWLSGYSLLAMVIT